jgi:hypothetical protein
MGYFGKRHSKLSGVNHDISLAYQSTYIGIFRLTRLAHQSLGKGLYLPSLLV